MLDRYELFTVLINRISRSIKKIKNTKMADYNLRNAHFSCLYYIYHNEGITTTELCEKCEEDKATVSRTLSFLRKNGFIADFNSDIKVYKSSLVLTKKGEEAAIMISNIIYDFLLKAGEGITDEDRKVLYRCLDIMSKNLENNLK